MQRNTRPPTMPFPHDDDEEDSVGVEDSLRGGTAQHRAAALPTPSLPASANLFASYRPPPIAASDSYAFASTPDGAIPPIPPWHAIARQQQQRAPPTLPSSFVNSPPMMLAGASSSHTPLPQEGRAAAMAQPPRLERPTQHQHQQHHMFATPPGPTTTTAAAAYAHPPHMPIFAPPRPVTAGMNMFHQHRPTHAQGAFSPDDASTSASASASFMFARPRAGGGATVAMSSLAALPRPLPPAIASTSAVPNADLIPAFDPSTTPANTLDMAALAAERRIREQRNAPRTPTESNIGLPPRRVVSFSTATTPTMATTPVNAMAAPPQHALPPRRIAPPAQAQRVIVGTREGDASTSHLARAGPTAMLGQPGGLGGDLSFSLSSNESSLPHNAAAVPGAGTRLFAHPHPSSTLGGNLFSRPLPPQQFPSTPQHQHQHQHASEPQSTSFSASSSSSLVSASKSSSTAAAGAGIAPIETVNLRKWDGTQTTLPAYLVSESAESAVEETFDFDTIGRFDVGALLAKRSAEVEGKAIEVKKVKEEREEEGHTDALKAILEVQLGLRGWHGWYGHTYRNPSKSSTRNLNATAESDKAEGEEAGGRTSRKRRRRDSSTSSHSSSSTSSSHDENEKESTADASPIIVYDTFGRIRGTVTLPDYAHRGGPAFPLPNPHETFALRHATTSHTILAHASAISRKEQKLVDEVGLLNERYAQLQDSTSRAGGTKGRGGEEKGGASTVRSNGFYKELKSKRGAVKAFHAKHREGLMKGLQNAYIESALVAGARR